MMVEYGMKNKEVLKATTSVNASVFNLDDLGRVKPNFLADMIIAEGNPIENIQALWKIKMVMKNGETFK